MKPMGLFFIGLCTVAANFCLFMLWRNNRVAIFRRWLLNTLHEHAREDLEAGRDYEWRYEAFESVGYDLMLNRFWKPLKPEVWFKDTSFLRPGK